jgi:hypothetical protein
MIVAFDTRNEFRHRTRFNFRANIGPKAIEDNRIFARCCSSTAHCLFLYLSFVLSLFLVRHHHRHRHRHRRVLRRVCCHNGERMQSK